MLNPHWLMHCKWVGRNLHKLIILVRLRRNNNLSVLVWVVKVPEASLIHIWLLVLLLLLLLLLLLMY
jgi:hypothetical protein